MYLLYSSTLSSSPLTAKRKSLSNGMHSSGWDWDGRGRTDVGSGPTASPCAAGPSAWRRDTLLTGPTMCELWELGLHAILYLTLARPKPQRKDREGHRVFTHADS
eukprot:1306281-Pyramimonas_sp.AAC.2